MTNSEGNKVRGFKEMVDLKVQHFKDIFKEPISANIVEILKVISFFLGGLLMMTMKGCSSLFLRRSYCMF
jgi:hypothetical protein